MNIPNPPADIIAPAIIPAAPNKPINDAISILLTPVNNQFILIILIYIAIMRPFNEKNT